MARKPLAYVRQILKDADQLLDENGLSLRELATPLSNLFVINVPNENYGKFLGQKSTADFMQFDENGSSIYTFFSTSKYSII